MVVERRSTKLILTSSRAGLLKTGSLSKLPVWGLLVTQLGGDVELEPEMQISNVIKHSYLVQLTSFV